MSSLGLTSFYYWFRVPTLVRKLRTSLLELLEQRRDVTGVELSASLEQVAEWAIRLPHYQQQPVSVADVQFQSIERQLLCLPHNSVHINDLRLVSLGQEQVWSEQLRTVYEYTGITEFAAHPDGCSAERLYELACAVPEPFRSLLKTWAVSSGFRRFTLHHPCGALCIMTFPM